MRGQTQRAAAQDLEFRNIHISAAAMRQGSKWQKVITKGTFHCTGSGELSAREGGRMEVPSRAELQQARVPLCTPALRAACS